MAWQFDWWYVKSHGDGREVLFEKLFTIEVEGNCKIVELKHKYEILNVLLERKGRKTS
jgi:hypothetical protein